MRGDLCDVRGSVVVMTREELRGEVLSRVEVPAGKEGQVNEALRMWVEVFPKAFVFGPREVQFGIRLLNRELVMGRG